MSNKKTPAEQLAELFPNGIPGASTTDNAKPTEKPADTTTSSETKGEQPKVEEKTAEAKTSPSDDANNADEEVETPPEENVAKPSKDDGMSALKTKAEEIIERMKSDADISVTDATSTVFELHEHSFQRQEATEVAHRLNNSLLEYIGDDSSRIKEYFEAIVMIAENVEEKNFEYFLLGPLAYRLSQLRDIFKEYPQKFYSNSMHRRHMSAMTKIMSMREAYEVARDFIPFCMGDKGREIFPRDLKVSSLTHRRLKEKFQRDELETHLEMLKYMLTNGGKPESELDEEGRKLRITHDGQRRRAEWVVKRLEKFLHGAPDTRLGRSKVNARAVAEELLKKRSSARDNTAKDNTSRAEASGQQEDEMEIQKLKEVFDRHGVPYGFLQEVDQLKGFPDKLDPLHADVLALQMETKRAKKLRDIALTSIRKANEIVKAAPPPRNTGNERRRSDPPPPNRTIIQQNKLDAILSDRKILIGGRISMPEMWNIDGLWDEITEFKKAEGGHLEPEVWNAWLTISREVKTEFERRSGGPRKSPSGDKHKATPTPTPEEPKDASPKGDPKGIDKLDAEKSEAELVRVLTPLGITKTAMLYRYAARGESQARYEARVVKAVGSVKDIDKLEEIRGDLYELRAHLHESTIEISDLFLTELQRVVDAAAKAEAKKTKKFDAEPTTDEDEFKGDPLKRLIVTGWKKIKDFYTAK